MYIYIYFFILPWSFSFSLLSEFHIFFQIFILSNDQFNLCNDNEMKHVLHVHEELRIAVYWYFVVNFSVYCYKMFIVSS